MSRNQTAVRPPPSQPLQARRRNQRLGSVNTQPPTYRSDRLAGRRLVQNDARGTAPVRSVTSEELFRGAQEIAIEHAGAIYRLKITRQGKLILNK